MEVEFIHIIINENQKARASDLHAFSSEYMGRIFKTSIDFSVLTLEYELARYSLHSVIPPISTQKSFEPYQTSFWLPRSAPVAPSKPYSRAVLIDSIAIANWHISSIYVLKQ